MSEKQAYLIDASIYVFKSYYVNYGNYTASNGENINAVYGFTRFLTDFIHKTKAQHIACAFDESLESSYRNEIYPPYKANREPAPEDLKRQFKLCQEVANVLGISTYSDGYYEADDLIGTLAHHHQKQGFRNHIVSADKDLAQLVGENDTWWNYGKDEPMNPDLIKQKFGVYPHQIADYLALCGDSVDNIPGVSGIGIKTAIHLINHFDTLQDVMDRNKEIAFLSIRGAKSCQKKIADNLDQAKLAKSLTEIRTDIPLENIDIRRKRINTKRINQLFDFLQLGPMLRRRILDLQKI